LGRANKKETDFLNQKLFYFPQGSFLLFWKDVLFKTLPITLL